jgi:DNA-binding PadR family transcriptional regulator
MPPESIDRHLPLSPAVFHLLLALAEEDRHGYALMQTIEERTNGLVKVGPGMLYGSIKWLLEENLIDEASKRGRGKDKEDDRRKVYRLTADGRAVVKAEAARLEAAVGLARSLKVLGKKA